MKKCFLLMLCAVLVISAFAGCEEAEESKADISKNESQVVSADVSEEMSETEESSPTEENSVPEEISVPDESNEISVVDIVCDFEGKYHAQALETIYMDETYIYVLGSYCSQDIIVTYSDGSRQNVKDALADGNITIEDLDSFDIRYTKRLKSDFSTDESPDLVIKAIIILPGAYNDTTILAYSDGEYDYYLPAMTKDNTAKCYINVYYSDESNQNVMDALADGNVTIEDLDRFDIRYTKVPKSDSSTDESPTPSDLEVIDIVLPSGCYSELIDLFYSDDEYDYFFPSLTKYHMQVYYSDGSVQNVKQAIDAGNITLADLDKFDIYYFKETKGKYSSFD